MPLADSGEPWTHDTASATSPELAGEVADVTLIDGAIVSMKCFGTKIFVATHGRGMWELVE